MSETEAVTTPAAVESPPPITDESAGAPDVDLFEDTSVQSFDRAYVEKLRKENAERRTQVKKYEETFKGYEPDEVDIWDGIIKLTAMDTRAGAEAMAKLAAALLADGDVEGAEKVIEAAEAAQDDADDQPMTRKEMREFLANQDKEKADHEAIQAVQTEAAGLGYKVGTADYLDLLNRAKLNHDYDITKAHAAREAEKQGIIDAYIAERAEAGDKWLKAPGGVGQPPNDERAPKDFKSAKESLRERLKNL